MTRTPRILPARRRRAVATALVATTAALALLTPSPASAATARAASPEIGDVASDALAALERWQASTSLVDYTAFVRARNRAADLTAAEIGLPGVELADAWADVTIDKQHVVLAAISQLGVPYRSQASSEGKAFDCSGLMLYAFRQAGVELPRSSGDQIRSATTVEAAAAEPGDLVQYPGHVSMYIGHGLVVHSPYSGSEVEVRPIFDRSLRFGEVFDGDEQRVAVPAVPSAPVATVAPTHGLTNPSTTITPH